MAFEKFTKVGKTFRPKISIRMNGQIGFSNGARERFKLDGYEYVVLYFDKTGMKIGIQPSNDKDGDGVIRLHKRPLNMAISAKSFLEYYSISYNETKTYDPEWNEELQMIVIDLKSMENQ